MKKSNKISIFYILSSVMLLGVLFFGGVYGVYISVGLNFVRSSISNISNSAGASNVAFGGTVNFESSMTGIIILSISLVILAIFDLISLIKQIVLFKQFKVVRNSKFEENLESKTKSKGGIIFFAGLIDVLSLIVGVVGIFLNARTFVGNNLSWVLYLVDGLVVILSIISLVLLIIKIKQSKSSIEEHCKKHNRQSFSNHKDALDNDNEFNIDKIEYSLLKLKYLKSNRIISADESEILRNRILKRNDKEDEENL